MENIDYILEHLNHPETLNNPEFIHWLQQEENFRLFEEVRVYREVLLRDNQKTDFCTSREYQRIQRRIKWGSGIKWTCIAAAACLLVGLGALALFYPSGVQQTSVASLPREIPVGRKTAELILSDGHQINLTGNAQDILENDEEIANNTVSCQLNYRAGKLLESPEEQVWHTIRIPSRADYFVKLSDGTKVWLNCDSELKFPVDFTSESREVFLEGEAFFEVSKAEEWPFIVHADKMSIRVTGTKFNVKSYASESWVHTTLVEGCVLVNQVRLNPSQQFLMDKHTGKTEVKLVDTELYTGWTSGMFVFQGQRLEDVMNSLAKWYDVTVIYRDTKVKEMRFSGNFGRYDTIDDVLDILRKLEKVNFSRDGQNIIISNR